jgi:hypothetical protein
MSYSCDFKLKVDNFITCIACLVNDDVIIQSDSECCNNTQFNYIQELLDFDQSLCSWNL